MLDIAKLSEQDRLALAKRIETAIDEKPGLKRAAVATECGVSPQAVNGWINTGRITKRNLQKLAQLTGKPLPYFFGTATPTPAWDGAPTEEARPERRVLKMDPKTQAILLSMFDNLTLEQQDDLMTRLHKFHQANQPVLKELGPQSKSASKKVREKGVA